MLITVDQLFPLSRVLEGAWELAQPVYMCFGNLEKAFDRVPWGVIIGFAVKGCLCRVGAWSALPAVTLTCFR